jgi:hypothetical protein
MEVGSAYCMSCWVLASLPWLLAWFFSLPEEGKSEREVELAYILGFPTGATVLRIRGARSR